MTARQVCNFAYANLAEGRNQAQMAELEMLLTDPADKEQAAAEMNRRGMEMLAGFGMPPPERVS